MASYEFVEEPRGGVGMRIVAADRFEMFDAAVGALCLFMWEQERVEAREGVEVSWYGFDLGTTVVGLLSELLYRMDRDRFVFKRFETLRLEQVDELDDRHRRHQLKVTGTAWGEPFDPTRHQPRFPVQAVLLPKLRVTEESDGVRLYCILDA